MRRLWFHLALGLVLAGCERGDIVSGVSDSVYVTTLAELRNIQVDESRDSARKAIARDSVLQGRGLTPEQLERASRAVAREPARAVQLWQRIEAKAITLDRGAPAPPLPPRDLPKKQTGAP